MGAEHAGGFSARPAGYTVRRVLRGLLPAGVSVGLLAYLGRQIDFSAAAAAVTPRALALLVPALLGYAGLSLWIEGVSLTCIARGAGRALDVGTAARIKAASYVFGLIHYALGAGALVALLRRRGGLLLGEAAGMVMAISGIDLLVLLAITAGASTTLVTAPGALRAGLVAALLLAVPAGLAGLRMERSLGPLDRLRDHAVLRALRGMPRPELIALLVLRAVFVLLFIALGGVALAVFGVWPPPGAVVRGFAILALVAALPIAVAGLGTGQVAVVQLFRDNGEAATLVAASLVLSAGIILMRVALATAFAGEYTRDVLASPGARDP